MVAALVALLLVAALLALPAAPAGAVEGGSTAADTKFNRSTVRVTTNGSTCSGVLIAKNLVLTARHCVRHNIPDPAPHAPREGYIDWELPDRFYNVSHTLPAGINVLFGQDSNNPMLKVVTYEYSLPGDVDIMMLRLPQDVPSNVASPVDVITEWGMNNNKLTPFLAEQTFEVFGYGKTSATSNFSNIQQEGRSNGASFPCPYQQDGWVMGDIHRMCLKGADGTGVRSGDSGGPAYWYDAAGKRHVVGIFQGLESFHNGGRYVALWFEGGIGPSGERGDVAGWINNHLGPRIDIGPDAVPTADFDGDGKPDIIRDNGIFYVRPDGTRQQLAGPGDLKSVRIGNFDTDPADELLWAVDGKWTAQNLDGSTFLLSNKQKKAPKLRFADLNGDGLTDVLYRHKNKRRLFVSYSGTTDWQPVQKTVGRPKLSKLRAADFGNDGVADIFTGVRGSGVAKVSYGGAKYTSVEAFSCGSTKALLDFKGDGYASSVSLHC